MFANLTPPVALAAFAAAGLSGGNPMKTGWQSVKLSIAGFVVPYMFIYSPALMLIDTTFFGGLQVAVTAGIGVFLIASAVEGFLFTKISWPLRILMFGGALCLIDAGLYTDLIGLAVAAVALVVQRIVVKRERAAKLQAG